MAESPYGISAVLSVGYANPSVATWNSATPLNTVANVVSNDYSYNTLNISLALAPTITGGIVLFQGSYDGINWFNMQGFTPGNFAAAGPSYSLVTTGSPPPPVYATFQFNLTGVPYFQIQLSSPITGAGSVTIGYAADSFVNTIAAAQAGTWTVQSVQSGPWSVSATQGTSPWVVSGTVAATQGTSPWVVQDSVAEGYLATLASTVANAGSPPVPSIRVAQESSPWVVSGTVTANQGDPWTVGISGTVAVTQSTSPWVVSGTVTANQGTSPWTVSDAAAIGLLTTLASTVVTSGSPAHQSLDVANSGIFAVQATQSGVWTVGISPGQSISVTQGTTPWAVNDAAAVGYLATIASTILTSGSPPHQSMDVANAGTFAVQATQSGVWTVGVTQVTSPWVVSNPPEIALLTTLASTVVSSAGSPPHTSIDVANSGTFVVQEQASAVSNVTAASWTSATAVNTAINLVNGTFAYNTVVVTLNQTSTITGGAVLFEISNDNANWIAASGVNVMADGNDIQSYTLQASTYIVFKFNIGGFQYFRVRLNPVITGTGTVTIGYSAHSNGVPPTKVQEFKDSGRTYVTLTIVNGATVGTEALTSFIANKGGVAAAAATSYTVTAGKTFRIQSMTFQAIISVGSHNLQLRLRAATTVLATSPILITGFSSGSTSAAGMFEASIPDGLEIVGGTQLGITNVADTPADVTINATVVGYEY